MQDDITLIEQIQRKQTEIAGDLEKLKNKENEQYADDIQAIQEHQSEVASEVKNLQNKIKQEKNGGQK
jgi:Txe/YoeB family toxin of Txe-Axe toxin-antitoxin module